MKLDVPYKQMPDGLLAALANMLHEIWEQLAMGQDSEHISLRMKRIPQHLPMESHLLEDEEYVHYLALRNRIPNTLKQRGVIKSYKGVPDKDGRDATIEMSVNPKPALRDFQEVMTILTNRGFFRKLPRSSLAKQEEQMWLSPYELTKKARKLCINDTVISVQSLNSENDNLITHLISHPNQLHTRKKLKEKGISVTKNPRHVVNDLGFKGIVADAFFTTSKDSIILHNPVTAYSLDKRGIDKRKFYKALEGFGLRELYDYPTIPRPEEV